MDSPDGNSVTAWLERMKAGDEAAAQELWNRYFLQLVTLARGRLYGAGWERDEEDVALSALKSAMLGIRNQRFPELHDRTGLWPLLVTITARKVVNEVKRQRAMKRDRAAEAQPWEADQVAAAGPTPEFALQLVETIERLVQSLGDEKLRTIVSMKLEGRSNDEIAAELDVSTRTVVRKLRLIRQEWEESGKGRLAP